MFPFHPRCDFCSKPYNNYMSLRNHMRIHGQKRYACELCGKAFRLARYLRNHQKIHDDGPNRFDCPSCCKSFRTMLELAQHRCNAASGQVGVGVCVCVCECECECVGWCMVVAKLNPWCVLVVASCWGSLLLFPWVVLYEYKADLGFKSSPPSILFVRHWPSQIVISIFLIWEGPICTMF